jgi:hypothetical protein
MFGVIFRIFTSESAIAIGFVVRMYMRWCIIDTSTHLAMCFQTWSDLEFTTLNSNNRIFQSTYLADHYLSSDHTVKIVTDETQRDPTMM